MGGGDGRSENCQEDIRNVCICWRNIVDDQIYIGGMIMDLSSRVEPLFYDHPQNQIGVVVKEGWSSTRGLTIL